MNREQLQEWLDRYVEAWKTYDADRIGALFSDDARYRHGPEDEPIVGRAAIVADWLAEPDEPGTYEASYAPLAIEGDVHVAHGTTHYFDADRNPSDRYSNIYICRFNAAGECTDFTEIWFQGRDFRRLERAE